MIDVAQLEYLGLRDKRRVPPEAQMVVAGSPGLEIVHRYRPPGVEFCVPGEEISAAWLLYGERRVQLRLSLALRLVLDNMAKHRLARSALQIEASLRADPFYTRHAANVRTSQKQTRKFTRAGVKTYIGRLREAFRLACEELGAGVGCDFLVSEPLVGGGVGYRLRQASVYWVHLP